MGRSALIFNRILSKGKNFQRTSKNGLLYLRTTCLLYGTLSSSLFSTLEDPQQTKALESTRKSFRPRTKVLCIQSALLEDKVSSKIRRKIFKLISSGGKN